VIGAGSVPCIAEKACHSCPGRVKTGKSRSKQMFSGLAQSAWSARQIKCHVTDSCTAANGIFIGQTLKRDHEYELSPIGIPAMADGSPQLF
jgi:hypothetical protein